MTTVDLFGAYVRTRLDAWGYEFAYHRDREFLGHKSKDMLQVLVEHKGEMPPRPTGFKPLEVCPLAQQVEDIVRVIHQSQDRDTARALRAYYCGSGRRGVERFEFFLALRGEKVSKASYFARVAMGQALVRAQLLAIAQGSSKAA